MIKETTDANTVEQSSTSTDDNGADSSQQQQDVNTNQSNDSSDTNQTTDDGDGALQDNGTSANTTGDDNTDDQNNSQQQQDVKGEEDPNVVLDKPEDKDLPFHKEPRFQELVAQKNEARQQLEAVKPLADQARALQDYMTSNGIPPQELQAFLEYATLKRTNPQLAFERLQGDYNALALMNGASLPPDLQAEVAAATMSPERAKEIARLRGQTQYQSWQQQNGQMNQQQQQVQMIQAASSQWTQNKQIADPDLKPGSNLWQLVQDKINAQPPFRSPQEAYAGSEKAYTDAKAFLAKLQPRQVVPSRRVNQHRNSSANEEVVVKTAEDVTKLFIANGGRRPTRIKYA